MKSHVHLHLSRSDARVKLVARAVIECDFMLAPGETDEEHKTEDTHPASSIALDLAGWSSHVVFTMFQYLCWSSLEWATC